MYTLQSTEKFDEDVKSAVKYILDTFQEPVAAQRIKDKLKEAYKKVKLNPFTYPAVPDEFLASKGFRFIMVKKRMAFYIVEDNVITMIRFLYGGMDWMNILRDEEEIN